MKTTALAAFIAALVAPACVHGTTQETASLVLNFETSAATGAVMVSLFDSEASYAGGAPFRQARVDVANGERATVFAGLPAGHYAVKAFHDVNGDGRMNTNPFGVPAEPFAFSNNARGNMGAAAWARARVEIAGDTAQTIDIR